MEYITCNKFKISASKKSLHKFLGFQDKTQKKEFHS